MVRHTPPAARTPATASLRTADLLQLYDRPGPRYTSYPTAVEFTEGFDETAYRARLREAADARGEPLSLYVHLPFCETRCTYCGCMTIITRRRDVAARYLDYLEREVALLAAAVGPRPVVHCHWGGGTPTYLSCGQIERLHRAMSDRFHLAAGAELAVEIDPRVTTVEQLEVLRGLGFNRLSMGVQDFAPAVQEAIGRRQTESQTRRLYEAARALGFGAVNLDLVYGLPLQTLDAFTQTLRSVVAMRPDRVAVYSYAHVPWLRPHQSGIDASTLPDRALKFELFGAALEHFGEAGYEAIGMDHFALPDDDLAVAARSRSLHRNFMGYTTRCAADMLGLGVSAIGDVRGAFAQNVKKLPPYYAAIDAERFPIERGYALTADDRIRQYVIEQLMCNFFVERGTVEARFGIDFGAYFAAELSALSADDGPAADGLLTLTPGSLDIPPPGRLFVRNICMHFDRYLAGHAGQPAFSRTI